MIKKKISLILCTIMITGCFAQSAFAKELNTKKTEIAVNTTNKNTSKPAQSENNTKSSAADKKVTSAPNEETKKKTQTAPVSKVQFPKVDFNMLSSTETFDTTFHSTAYQESLINKCLINSDKLNKYNSAISKLSYNQKFRNASSQVSEYRTDILFNQFTIEENEKVVQVKEAYKAANKNLSKDALDYLNQSIQYNKNQVSKLEKKVKEDTASYNKFLKEARSYETAENKNDYENIMTAAIMSTYCRRETKQGIAMVKDLKNYGSENVTNEILKFLKGKPITNLPAESAKKTTTKAKASPVTKTKASSNKALPKTGGFEAAPIASVTLILSGAALAIVNKIKRH